MPFRHWIIDSFGDRLDLMAALRSVPWEGWDGWVRYSNELERNKRTTEDFSDRHGLRKLFADIAALTPAIASITGITSITPTVRCGGLHIIDPGGHLATHIDASLYPDGMERVLNLVLFLTPTWPLSGGGELMLYEDDARTVATMIAPKFGRAVLWESNDTAYHGVATVAKHAPPRTTAAMYYLAPARPSAVRKRALFCPARG